MAFPTTSVLDTFPYGNGDLPVVSGGIWTGLITGGEDGPLYVITDNVASGGGTVENAWWNGATFGPDCEVFTTVITRAATFIRLWARIVNPGSTPFAYSGSFGLTAYSIYRRDGLSETQLGASMSTSTANGDQVGLSCVGSTITVYRNGTVVGTRTDPTYTSAGYIGLEVDDGTGLADDFGGGTYDPTPEAPSTMLVMGMLGTGRI